MHGCGGLGREATWTAWVRPWVDLFLGHGVGTAVVDSFGPRGVDQVCNTGNVAGWAIRRADDVVAPAHQRRGIGSRIVRALTEHVERVPFKNTWVGVFAVEGTAEFYAQFGYKTQRPSGPAMARWLNTSDV